MIGLNLNGTDIATDDEGYLLNPQDWSPELAELLANSIDLELTEERLEIVHFVREYFEERECIPELRTLLKTLRERHGKDTATRKYVYDLFTIRLRPAGLQDRRHVQAVKTAA